MFDLKASVENFPSESFPETLIKELSGLNIGTFTLDKFSSHTGYIDENSLEFSLLSLSSDDKLIYVNLGIYFQEYTTTCPCSGEQPMQAPGYCEQKLVIDRQTAIGRLVIT